MKPKMAFRIAYSVLKMKIKIKENRFRKTTETGRAFLLLMILLFLTTNLTACGSNDTENVTDKAGSADVSETAGDMAQDVDSDTADEITSVPETPEEITLVPETYEDYMKLAAAGYQNEDWEIAYDCYRAAKELDGSRAEVYRGLSDTYLQMGDVVQALEVLDEGIDKLSMAENDIEKNGIDLLSQRKEYVLAGMVAVGTNSTTNRYDDDGSILYESVRECDEYGNEKSYNSVYYYENGEISSAEEYQYDRNGNKIEDKYISYDIDGSTLMFSHKTWAYDAAGNEIEYVKYDENGDIEARAEREYDANGNQIKAVDFDEDNIVKRREEIEYDAGGNEIKRELHVYGHTEETIRTYDEYGNLILCVIYNRSYSRIDEKIKYEYDENGNMIKEVHHKNPQTVGYWTERDLDFWWEYEYDENGREIKSIRHDSDGTVNWNEIEYDENGNKIRDAWYNGEGTLEQTAYEWEYDENGREVNEIYKIDGIVRITEENEYDEDGYIIKEIQINYDNMGRKTKEEVCRYTYDEKKNMIKYALVNCEGKETESLRWEKEYDEEGRGTAFYLYDNEKAASYQSRTEYDENDRIIKYMACDKKGNILVRRETEYDDSGKTIKENYYDEAGKLIQYYENEYDDFGSIIRQSEYKDGILKSEKQMSYAYHFIGNIDAEAADYVDNDITPEEYNQKQREIFIRFLNGQEKIRYYRNENNIKSGKIVSDTIEELIDKYYTYINDRETLQYTFLDITGDGIEELIINCGRDRLCVIQCSYGVLKVIHATTGGPYKAYLIKYNGKIGIRWDYGINKGEEKYDVYYFLNGKGKKEISLEEYQDWWKEKIIYSAEDNDSFEERDIEKGEYYDIMSGIVKMTDIDWYKLEEPDYGND